MLVRVHELIQQDLQGFTATHFPIVMAYPDSIIYEIDATESSKQPTRKQRIISRHGIL